MALRRARTLNRDERQSVSKTATCKRCGFTSVTWQTSAKTGKWFLTEVWNDLDGNRYTGYTDFHSAYCGKHGLHDEEQARRIAEEQSKRNESDEQANERAEKEDAANVAYFLALLDLSDAEKEEKLGALNREEDAFKANPPTMDYMTEFEREISRAKRRRAEIEFLLAALSNSKAKNGEES